MDNYIEADYGFIYCDCGEEIPNDLPASVEDSGGPYSGYVINETEKVECPECGAQYLVHVKAIVTTEIEEISAELISGSSPILKEIMNGLMIGDKIDLEDGSYLAFNREVIVENGIVQNIFNVPDHNQLSLFN